MHTLALPTRPVKLVDARTGRPVARATVRLEYPVGPRAQPVKSLTSSPLGWVFVPLGLLMSGVVLLPFGLFVRGWMRKRRAERAYASSL